MWQQHGRPNVALDDKTVLRQNLAPSLGRQEPPLQHLCVATLKHDDAISLVCVIWLRNESVRTGFGTRTPACVQSLQIALLCLAVLLFACTFSCSLLVLRLLLFLPLLLIHRHVQSPEEGLSLFLILQNPLLWLEAVRGRLKQAHARN